MNDAKETPPSRIAWPPLLYLTAAFAGIALQYALPLPWIPGPVGEMALMLGLLLMAAAVFIDVRTFQELRKHKTTILPTRAASHLVTGGPFSFSRNPIYLANTMLVSGLGFALGNAWLFATAVLAVIAVGKLAIEPEERHLSRKFGSAWHHYAKRVRRWI
ncbi:MAG: isoprenylcysteine carboxylmethyltransferase family protein [Hyphomicrobiales bacterium]|nr:isoprenylcysteine carboxylmethyltransferase family protein [Nitratireductor sp.]MCC2096544.1 isoprenylcysteine carboxylmethyltransferase family protein [Hyphomicrobiales bacterium]